MKHNNSSVGILFCLVTIACLAGSAAAGPNAGGLLVAHDASLLLSATDGSVPLCAQGTDPSGLGDVDARIDGADSEATAAVFKVYAVFPSSPRLLGVTFGIQYTGIVIPQGAAGSCDAQLELPSAGWPGSGTGIALVWPEVRTAPVVPVYAFAAYLYAGNPPSTLDLTPEPSQGGWFGDDDAPPVLDPVAGYGKIGFDRDGHVPPPAGEPGACCDRLTGECRISLWADCEEDIWHGAGTLCETTDCGRGACCLGQGLPDVCQERTPAECQALGGYFFGLDRRCDPGPSPCESDPWGACCDGTECRTALEQDCLPDQQFWPMFDCAPEGIACDPGFGACCNGADCQLVPVVYCLGTFLGAGTDCRNDICTPPWGACCNGANCQVLQEQDCTGLWLMNQACEPQNICAETGACYLPDSTCQENVEPYDCQGAWVQGQPCVSWAFFGACCTPKECSIETEEDCAAGATWLLGVGCHPNPCATAGACCSPSDGTCRLVAAQDCGAPDVWHGEWASCDPNPCPQPLGACCSPTGECTLTAQADCASPGVWHPEWTSCTPQNPCPQPVPTDATSWGSIKNRYR